MKRVSGAADRIEKAVLSWEGVSAHPHRFGGTEFRLGRREFGHIHGDSLVDIPFPRAVRDELVASGRARPHHILPQSGWVSFYLGQESDVDEAIKLMNLSFEVAKAHHQKQVPAAVQKASAESEKDSGDQSVSDRKKTEGLDEAEEERSRHGSDYSNINNKST